MIENELMHNEDSRPIICFILYQSREVTNSSQVLIPQSWIRSAVLSTVGADSSFVLIGYLADDRRSVGEG
jgi:hypothetical protein